MQREQEGIARHLLSARAKSALYLLDDSCLRTPKPGAYYHKVVFSCGLVSIDRLGKEDESGNETLKLQSRGTNGNLSCYEI